MEYYRLDLEWIVVFFSCCMPHCNCSTSVLILTDEWWAFVSHWVAVALRGRVMHADEPIISLASQQLQLLIGQVLRNPSAQLSDSPSIIIISRLGRRTTSPPLLALIPVRFVAVLIVFVNASIFFLWINDCKLPTKMNKDSSMHGRSRHGQCCQTRLNNSSPAVRLVNVGFQIYDKRPANDKYRPKQVR